MPAKQILRKVPEKQMSAIAGIGLKAGNYAFDQQTVLEYMQRAYKEPAASRKLSILSHQSGIKKRHSVIPDFSISCETPLLLLGDELPIIDERLLVYKENALPLAVEAINRAATDSGLDSIVSEITHIITVSCTGLYAPGMGIQLIHHYHLPMHTFHTAINFMGCNASFAALRMADLIVKNNPASVVLIVCVELCTLHFLPKNNNDNLLANTLFADGAAALFVTGTHQLNYGRKRVIIKDFCTLSFFEGAPLMSWDINAVAFEMVLSSQIPEFLKSNLSEITNKLFEQFMINNPSSLKWAVHPGGRKILDAFVAAVNLEKNDIIESYKILSEFGNMSSVTIIFILNEILSSGVEPHTPILSIGFGPGISVETVYLEVI